MTDPNTTDRNHIIMKYTVLPLLLAALVISFAACSDADSNPAIDGDIDNAVTDGDIGDKEAEIETEQEELVAGTACNGADSLCAKRFNEVVYPTAHNAMSNEEQGFSPPNHYRSMQHQLEDGIRAMMLDTYYHDEEEGTWLCHGACQLGAIRLSDGLKTITDFLLEHPREVFSIIFESYITPEDTRIALVESGMFDLLYTHTPDTPWPTLQEISDAKPRVVVFTQDDTGGFAWYHHAWDFIWDTDYANETPEDFSCGPGRGSRNNALYCINHFLTNPVAKPALAEQVNHSPDFLAGIQECQRETGQLPNFIAVDFYSIGDLFSVCNTLNGIE